MCERGGAGVNPRPLLPIWVAIFAGLVLILIAALLKAWS